MKKLPHYPRGLRRWLTAIDPGLIRVQSAGRAALTTLSIWLLLRAALQIMYGESKPPLPLFAVQSGIVFLLFIIDLKPADRKISLLLAIIPYAGGIILASLLAGNFWLNILVLLLGFFSAYFFRRYGPRAGELAMVAAVGYYLGSVLRPPPSLFPLLLTVIFCSVLIVYVWEFFLIPYDPEKSLRRSVRGYYHNIARAVAASRQALTPGQAFNPKNLHRHSNQVHRNRRVIEGLFAAAVSPTTWSPPRLNQLQEEMYMSERGLELLVDAAGELSTQLNAVPGNLAHTLQEGLAVLEEQLWEMPAENVQNQLSSVGESLLAQVKSILEEKPAGDWVFTIKRIGLAARQLSQSVAKIHATEIDWHESKSPIIVTKPPGVFPSPVRNNAAKKFPLALHPTTVLGLQAALASGLAMLAATILKMDSPTLVFWTAFVVIAGSTGESLRRISLRVIGVISGTLIGVGLAIILPENLSLIVGLVSVCLFMAVFVLTVSYLSMVFWLNIAMLLVTTRMGGAALDLLETRILSTLLGAAIAALVVTFILPIRVHDRFAAALSSFLRAVDEFLSSFVAEIQGNPTTGNLDKQALKIDASYKKLELTLPGVAYEYNPLTRSQSQLASQATSLAVLKETVSNLRDGTEAESGGVSNLTRAGLVQAIQEQIHSNIDSLIQSLAKGVTDEPNPPEQSKQALSISKLEEIFMDGAAPMNWKREKAIEQWLRIHDTIFQIGVNLGAPVTSKVSVNPTVSRPDQS